MDRQKQWVALTVVAVLAVLAAGWLLLISPRRQDAADLRQQAVEAQQATSTLRNQLAVLKTQADGLPAEQAKLGVVAAKLPDKPEQPALLRALVAAADGAGVEFISLTPGALTAVAGDAAVTPSPTASATTEADAAAVTPSTAGASTGSLMSMSLTINVAGGYYQIAQYIASLEDLPRAVRITGLAVTPGANPVAPTTNSLLVDSGKALTAAITGSVFVAAGSTTATAAVAPQTSPAN